MADPKLERCQVNYRASLAVDVDAARKQLRDAARVAIIFTPFCGGLLVFWVVLLVVRYRFLKRREQQFAVEIFCVLLTIAAFVGLAVAVEKTSPDRRLPFMEPVEDELQTVPGRWVPILIKILPREWNDGKICVKLLRLTPAKLKEVRRRTEMLTLSFKGGPLYIVAVVLCTLTALLFLTSVISTFVVMMVRRRPMPLRNTRVVPAPLRSIPESKKAEFFSRFIEDVPQPLDNIVLSANSQCTICLGAMLEDVACLPACQHMFHRKCILQWLMLAEKPNCPRCEVPLRLRTPGGGIQEERNDEGEEVV